MSDEYAREPLADLLLRIAVSVDVWARANEGQDIQDFVRAAGSITRMCHVALRRAGTMFTDEQRLDEVTTALGGIQRCLESTADADHAALIAELADDDPTAIRKGFADAASASYDELMRLSDHVRGQSAAGAGRALKELHHRMRITVQRDIEADAPSRGGFRNVNGGGESQGSAAEPGDAERQQQAAAGVAPMGETAKPARGTLPEAWSPPMTKGNVAKAYGAEWRKAKPRLRESGLREVTKRTVQVRLDTLDARTRQAIEREFCD